MIDITKPPYNATGNGKSDDWDNIVHAISDAIGGLDANGYPLAPARGLPACDSPGNATIYLPGGTALKPRVYRISKPIPMWGQINIVGDGDSTLIDGREIKQGRGLFEFQYVQLGEDSWWNGGCEFKNFKAFSGGHAFCTQKSGVGLLHTKFLGLTLVTRGWGIYFPRVYSQSVVIDHCLQFNPCAGAVALWGNLNSVSHYQAVNGVGAWDGQQGFKSPWTTERLGIFDLRGQGNRAIQNHCEFGAVEPIVPYYFGFYDPITPNKAPTDSNLQELFLDGNWSELHADGMLVDGLSYWFDHIIPHGYWEKSVNKCRYVNSGSVHYPIFNNYWGTLGQFCDDVDTSVIIDQYRSRWACEFPRLGEIKRAFIDSYGGKYYNPNPQGGDLEFDVTMDKFGDTEATFERTPGGFRIDVTKNGRPDGRPCAWFVVTPRTTEPWVLYSAEQKGNATTQWWAVNPGVEYGQDALIRTVDRRCSCPLPGWAPGAQFVLGAGLADEGVGRTGVTEYNNVRFTRLND
jgi:hypothetical protein